jgi:hypothetical protein
MSLVCQALVALTHYVLDGATWAGDRVWEQPVDPISDLLRGGDSPQQPVIAVYVESLNLQVSGRQTQGEKGEAELKIFVYVAPGKTKVPEGTSFALDGSTAGLTLNLMGRQVDAAFHGGDTSWLEVWRKFIVKVTRREIRYVLVEVEKAVKIPAMEICYRCDTIPDPDFGTPLYGAWLMFDTALRSAGGEKTLLADVFTGMIESPAGLPSFEDLQRNFGLTDAGLVGTGLAPINFEAVDDITGEPSTLDEVVIDSDSEIAPIEGDLDL